MSRKDQMAPNGYYVEYYGPLDENLSKPQAFGVQHIKDGKCCYVHFLGGYGWSTLNWNCALTKKALAKEQAADAQTTLRRSLYFATHADLLRFAHIGRKPEAMVPSPLDD